MKSLVLCLVLLNIIQGDICYEENRPFKILNKIYCILQNHCESYTTKEYTYRTLYPIKELDVPGFRARLSFFVLGERDAHVVLAGNDVAAWDIPTKDVYEILIGRNNINTIIRRRYKGKDEVVAQTAAILTTRAPLRVDVDVTTDGVINVYIEHTQGPIITWRDPNPLPLQYFSFAAYDSPVTFFYNCEGLENIE